MNDWGQTFETKAWILDLPLKQATNAISSSQDVIKTHPWNTDNCKKWAWQPTRPDPTRPDLTRPDPNPLNLTRLDPTQHSDPNQPYSTRPDPTLLDPTRVTVRPNFYIFEQVTSNCFSTYMSYNEAECVQM